MTQDTHTTSTALSPIAANAAAEIMLTACQRAFALHTTFADQMVNDGLEQSRQALADPRSLGAALQGAVARPTIAEPLWRYTAGMMAVYQSAAASLITLLTAQMRGAGSEVESISRTAHDEAEHASASAAEAASTAMTHGIEAMSRLGGLAAQAGQSLGSAFAEPVAQAAREAAASRATGSRAAAANSARRGSRASARPTGRR